ncbi:MAG: hypothetical protein JSR82_20785 [Verrucomicrobia bacterium]|nr:hypothetical protein [Verrucomicrobiota bacterium]
MKYLAASQECAHGPQVAGPEAALLGRLEQAPGVECVPWLAVLPAALPASLNPWQTQAYEKVRRGADLAELIAKIAFSPPVARELEKALRGLGGEWVDLVVAQAGGAELAHVPAERAAARLLDLWQAAARALGESITPDALPAVLVRQSRPADASCRTLSFDAAAPGRKRSTIFALPGRRVEADAPCDRFVVEDDGTLVQAQKAAKLRAFLPAPAGGLEARAVPADLAQESAIDGAQLRELAALTRRAAEHVGRPVLLDWVLEAGRPRLLAAQPEALPEAVPGEDRSAVRWDSAPAERWLSGEVSPLGYTVARGWLGAIEGRAPGGWARLGGRVFLRSSTATLPLPPPSSREDFRTAAQGLGQTAGSAEGPELAEAWLQLEALGLELAAATRAATAAAEAAVQGLADACDKNLGERNVALALLASAAGSPGAKFLSDFQRHGHDIHHEDELVRLLAGGATQAQLGALEALGERGRVVRTWATQAHPFPGEEGVDATSFVSDPGPLLRALGTFALGYWQAPYRPPSNGCGEIVQRAEQLVEQKLAGLAAAPRRWTVQRALKEAKASLASLENLELARRAAAEARRAILAALGRILRGEGALAAAADVAWLQIDELIGYFRGPGVDADLVALCELRRRAPAPSPLATRQAETGGTALRNPAREVAPATPWAIGETRRGTAAALGTASGPVHVLRDARRDALPQGAVLVARAAEPGWILHLPSVSAVVLEFGSIVDPFVRLARHLGVPVVVGVEGASDALVTGDWLQVDGAAGAVQHIEEAVPRAEGELAPTPATSSIRLPPSRFGVQRK